MKEYIAETGGRYTYSDDILNVQELALSMSAVFDGCSDFIISGCEIEGPRVSCKPSSTAWSFSVTPAIFCAFSSAVP